MRLYTCPNVFSRYVNCNNELLMANILPIEKQIAVIGALAEGTSTRAIERLTGIHQNTIGRLGVRVGQACEKIMDEQMRGLTCSKIQLDEIWGFIGKKQKNLRPGDEKNGLGKRWTFIEEHRRGYADGA